MTALAAPAELVRHSLALGLRYVDAATGAALSAPLGATLETVGARVAGLALGRKAAGAALRLDRRVARLFRGPANGVAQAVVLIAPVAGLGHALPPDRSVIPRRLRILVALDGEGLPRAGGDDPEGKWLFTVRMHCGPTFPMAAGVTAIRGRVARPDPADPEGQSLRWAHIVARLDDGTVVATARTDDRGEYVLRIRGRPGQTPNSLKAIEVDLIIHAPPAAPPPVSPYADLATETLAQPDAAADVAPAGVAHTGPHAKLMPGEIVTLRPTFLLPP